MKERDDYWDIVKGIGILSIVAGHTWETAMPYVYIYHLTIFFFVGAYFYREDKFAENPYAFIGKVLKGNYTRFILYTWLLIALHNLCVRQGLYYGQGEYSLSYAIYLMGNALVFRNCELYGGALWFVPVYVIALTLLALTVTIAHGVQRFIVSEEKISQNNDVKFLFIAAVTFIIGICGVYYNLNHMEMEFHIHTSLVVFPICALAYYVRESGIDIKQWAKWWLTPFFFVIIIVMVKILGIRVELSQEQIGNGFVFYAASVLGIMFCLCAANMLLKTGGLKRVFSLLGRYSFTIMAMHFFVVKEIDFVCARMIGESNPEKYSKWVVAYPGLWPVYVLAGACLPALLAWILVECKNRLVRTIKAGKEING